jgi:secreted PhoX family phosphatase
MAHHPDEITNTSPNEHFQDVLKRAASSGVTRRNVLRGGVGLAALPLLQACGSDDAPAQPAPAPNPPSSNTPTAPTPTAPAPAEKTLGFSPVGKSLLDSVVLPAGYTFTVLHATGDRLVSSIPAYSNAGTETDDWSQRVGDHHDGMDLYHIGADGRFSATATSRAVLVVNHESSADAHFFHPDGQTSNGVSGKKFSQFGDWDLGTRPALEVLKEINHHGVSVVELRKGASSWSYVVDSLYNRRVTGQTPVRFGGPAAHLADIRALMVTAYDPTGATSRGTLNNCGHGITPWGTYLACEENWAVYFNMPAGSPAPDAKTAESRRRYGVVRAALSPSATSGSGQGWYTPSDTDDRFTRWNIAPVGASAAADFRNEPNTFGYNVEIDPLSTATPVKRVAMGRFAHEGAWCGTPVAGRPLAFYQGCDSRNEYIYKFVSAANWDERDIGGGLAAGDKYLNEGKLYAAKFDADGTGQWIELTIADPRIAGYATYAFANQADVYVNARHAADAVGATKMDRPEWGAVNPANGEVYMTLTNNNAANRTPGRTDAANPRAYADADGRRGSGNPNGHIIRWRENGDTSTAMGFTWDIFLFGAEEDMPANVNLSGLTASNSLSSPDGLWFSPTTGICWIETDDGAYTDETNCMLLAAIPGRVGDGGRITVQNSMVVSGAQVTASQDTFIGAALGERNLRRFLVGPAGAEITGVTETADGKTLFVNIQHPGENTRAKGTGPFSFESQWPGNSGYGPAGRPRSATIVITRTDGGVIGL